MFLFLHLFLCSSFYHPAQLHGKSLVGSEERAVLEKTPAAVPATKAPLSVSGKCKYARLVVETFYCDESLTVEEAVYKHSQVWD